MVIGDRLRQLREESPTLPNTPNTQHAAPVTPRLDAPASQE
jgi:hypothetical protein